MHAAPHDSSDFISQVRDLFGGDESGIGFRTIRPVQGPHLTAAFLTDLMQPETLRAILLQPAAARNLPDSVIEIAREGLLPASHIRAIRDPADLRDGILAGLAAVHAAGRPEILLIGEGTAAAKAGSFGTDLNQNRALLRHALRSADLRIRSLTTRSGGLAAVAYLEGRARPSTVAAMEQWAEGLSHNGIRMPWWRAVASVLRLPPTAELSSPGVAAAALSQGYVAVLSDHRRNAQIGPATLSLFLMGPGDGTLTPAMRRLVQLPRFLCACSALFTVSSLAAVTSYHHAMLPGPFLVALAAGRQNEPLPIITELFLVQWLDDAMAAAALRIAGHKWTLLGSLATVLAVMAAFLAGLLSPIPAMVAILGAASLQVIPSHCLVQRLRLWRMGFTLMGAALGMYGIALLIFGLMVYLGEERHFGLRLRQTPEVSPQ